jgi:hypothetical protein
MKKQSATRIKKGQRCQGVPSLPGVVVVQKRLNSHREVMLILNYDVRCIYQPLAFKVLFTVPAGISRAITLYP